MAIEYGYYLAISEEGVVMTRLACAFTGHRPKKFPWWYNEDDPGCKRLKELLEQELLFWVQKGYTDFLSGMAEGTDTWAALMVFKLRDTYPKVKLHCILPCKSQADHWNSSAQICYRSILEQADSIIYVSREYHRNCMLERNRFLVDHAHLILAVYNRELRGGTACTVRYAIKEEKKVLLIDPTYDLGKDGVTI